MKKPISDHHEQIGKNIQKFREEHGLSIAQLSRSCHIEVAKLQRIERGEVNIRLTTLVRLMQVMGKALFPIIKKS